ncbi:MAG TPA: sensor domain-containing diguanylate cyclase [Acidimicrobiales bacterium]|nr:sensor domain-containing diguanylate cyclase [Acidimicrobiales bacterium]
MTTTARGTQLDRLHFLMETQRLINAGPLEADRVMALVIQRVQTVLNADGALVELAEGDTMVVQVAGGVVATTAGSSTQPEGSLSQQSVRLGMPLICRDAATDKRVDPDACRELGVRSLAVAPLMQSGRGVGALEVVSALPDQFGPADADVLELMAGFVTPALAGVSKLDQEAERALRDPLTGLPNKMILMDRLSRAVYEARRYGQPFGIFYVDIDHFAAINEALGREGGDAVLRAVGRGLNGTVRSGDTLARLEADQFVILCGNAERDVVEERLTGRIKTVIAKVDAELGLEGFELGVSIGVVWSTGNDASAESLLTAASTAAYRAKRQRYAAAGS